jgi:squalene monooxygenase
MKQHITNILLFSFHNWLLVM